MLPEMYVKKYYVKEKLPPPNPFAIQMLNFQKNLWCINPEQTTHQTP